MQPFFIALHKPNAISRTDALRMCFQKVAWTAGRVVRIAHGAPWPDLLLGWPAASLVWLLATANSTSIGWARVALITGVVASAAGKHGEERRRRQDEKCMSHFRCFLSPACSARRSFRIGSAGGRTGPIATEHSKDIDWCSGRRRRPGQLSRRLRTFRINAFQARLQQPGCGNWVETLETTSGGITVRIQKNVKTAARRKTRTFELPMNGGYNRQFSETLSLPDSVVVD